MRNGIGSGSGRVRLNLVLALSVMTVVAGCATPNRSVIDPEIRSFAESAATAYHRGDLARADEMWRKALNRARLIDDRGEIVRNAYNLGMCRISAGRYPEAMSALRQARALAGAPSVELSRIILAEAEIVSMDHASFPLDIDVLAHEAIAAGADSAGRLQAILLQGQAACAAGRRQEALEHYREAASAVSAATPALLRARLDDLAVRLVHDGLMTGNEAALMESQAGWLKKAGQYGAMATVLAGASDRYAEHSEFEKAFDCRIRAAQSLFAAGRLDSAREMLKAAAGLTDRTGNAKAMELVRQLQAELK